MKRWLTRLGVASILVSGCISPYPIPEISNESQFLVVDGFLNATDQTVRVKLSRTVNVSDAVSSVPEKNAMIFVEEENGSRLPLLELENGHYERAIAIDMGKKYRVEIIAAGKTYFSDFESVRIAPPIDSITWRRNDHGSSINLNTHDATNTTHYYMWTYEETWEYTAAFSSDYVYTGGGTFRNRLPNEDIYRCWHEQASSEILVQSSNELHQDIVSEFEIIQVPLRSEKLLIKYSVLVHQFALSAEAFEFWSQLKKNTESLGTLFDPQPSQTIGNVHATGGEEVLGYFLASTTTEKRFTISLLELPAAYRFPMDKAGCEQWEISVDLLQTFDPGFGNLVLPIYVGVNTLIGFKIASHRCSDCIHAGGIRQKPDFW